MFFRAALWYSQEKPCTENWINKYKFSGDFLVVKKKQNTALKVFYFIKKSNLAFIQVVKRYYFLECERVAKGRKIGLFLAI